MWFLLCHVLADLLCIVKLSIKKKSNYQSMVIDSCVSWPDRLRLQEFSVLIWCHNLNHIWTGTLQTIGCWHSLQFSFTYEKCSSRLEWGVRHIHDNRKVSLTFRREWSLGRARRRRDITYLRCFVFLPQALESSRLSKLSSSAWHIFFILRYLYSFCFP